ncbi:ankyrin repeat domain-containing protein [Wolbachia endosymbiont (group B) of Agriphila straminella]|uniref:ankyrin repeat domain-containing protein n=1 Tax=Wolbachia endosymbiont (group B) of Agriphila straminella TaxID=2953972 RepID=UPI002227F406|nr:ankyrin repeat domain-containing protein [Wolbachia endosymbiont (group B) of Agriphila straminella]
MTGEYESLKKVLRTIEAKKDLKKDNIIKKIQEELKEQDQGLYQEWEEDEFDVNHAFSLNISGIEYSKLPLLIIAAQNGYIKTVGFLIGAKADVNAKDRDECTALHSAADYGRKEIVDVLIRAEADVNTKDRNECTALHSATCKEMKEIVEVLLERGANVNAVDRYGKTPLDYAKMRIKWHAKERAKGYGEIYAEGYAKSESIVKALLDAGGRSFVKARNKAMIAGGVNTLLGTAIAVALFTTGIITAELIPIVIAVVAVTAAALVVGCATYELLKPSTKVDGVEKSSAALINGQQGVTSIPS